MVTGTAAVGRTLTAANGSWRGTAPISYSYQWQRCDAAGANCRRIDGATSTGYHATAADYLRTLRIRVAAKNRLGTTHTAGPVTAQVADLTPPGVTRFTRPKLHYQPSGGFTAAWQAHDPLSGVASYDIQTRRLTAASAGNWTDALVAQPDTSLALTRAGRIHHLPARAAPPTPPATGRPGRSRSARRCLGPPLHWATPGAGRRRATARCVRAAPARQCSGVA